MENQEQKKPPLEILCSRHFLNWLHEQNVSLVFTTYQSCRLFFLGLKPDGRLSAFERLFDHAMGLYATPERLYMSSKYQLWQFDNVLKPDEAYKGYDRLYVPRVGYTTGDLDVHDVVVDNEGRILFVNTLYSCLATLNDVYSFTPVWKPPFISKLAPEDRCHLNGLAVDRQGVPRYVTVVSRSDMFEGWREKRTSGGCLLDIASGEPVVTGLSMPHSPRIYKGRVWLLNSGTGELGYVDQQRGAFEPIAFCRGYTRGLAFHNNYAIVGLSKPRSDRTFTGLALDQRLAEKDTEPCCGLMIIDLNTGDTTHWMQLDGVTTELYDVQVLPGVRRPMALGHKTDEIKTIITLPPEHRQANNPAISRIDENAAPPSVAPDWQTSLVDYFFKLDDPVKAVDVIKVSGITFPNVQKRWQVKPSVAPMLMVSASLKESKIAAAVVELRHNGEHAEIISLYVAPEHRQLGIGARLVNLCEGTLARKSECRVMEIRYRSDWEDSAMLEKILGEQGWLPPKVQRILARSNTDLLAQAPWMAPRDVGDGLAVFPWPELTDEERQQILERKGNENSYPETANPFLEEDRIDPHSSVGLRKDGVVVGWMVNHISTPDTLQYSSLFIDPALRGQQLGLFLISEAVRRQQAVQISNMIWMIDAQNSVMRDLMEKHLRQWTVSLTEMRHSVRLLRHEAPGRDSGEPYGA